MPRVLELHPPSVAVREHRCAGFACREQIAIDKLMCEAHWLLVPDWLRTRLGEAYAPNAELRWPLHLVEQAIRLTMTTADIHALLGRVEESLQEDLFATARCERDRCDSALHCDCCLACDVTTKPRVITERGTGDRIDARVCDECAFEVEANRHPFFAFIREAA